MTAQITDLDFGMFQQQPDQLNPAVSRCSKYTYPVYTL